uniref:ATP synthase F0 subunit 6 n=1 Tax=Polymesoda caroliniana TaxID=98308 RepID=UPI002A8126B2|nr:ATP synthase F0 subunit 6 [Polymesoda caroliniana]WOV69035.1 ATP synthase F0 subunit 6 [Polymesoda caroliniana]
MGTDLFSSFDGMWGAGLFSFWFFLWVCPFVGLFYYLSFSVYFYKVSWFEAVLYKLVEGMVDKMKTENISFFLGGAHLYVTLFLFMLCVNLMGLMPFIYPLGIHILMIFGFAFPFWFMGLLAHVNLNWKLFLASQIESSEINDIMTDVVACMMIVSELVSILVRPITLCCRLSVSMFIGQLIMKFLTTFSMSLFYFSYFSVADFVLGVVVLGFTMFLFVVELCVAILQALIFTGLCVFYASEVKLKVE